MTSEETKVIVPQVPKIALLFSGNSTSSRRQIFCKPKKGNIEIRITKDNTNEYAPNWLGPYSLANKKVKIKLVTVLVTFAATK